MKNKIFLRAKCVFFAVLCVLNFSLVVSALPFERLAGNYSSLYSVSSLEQTESEIFALVNEQRRRGGLKALEWDDELARLARDYSGKMARGGFFDHHDSEGKTVVERAEHARIKDWAKIGENLFYCEGTDKFSRLAVRGWMESPTHKDNILDRDWNRSGIGIYEARDGGIYVTQVFIER